MSGRNLNKIADLIGVEKSVALARFARRCGKRRVRCLYIPRFAHPESGLAYLIGYEAFCLLCQEFGGGQITFGDPDRFLCLVRAKRLINEARLSLAEIAEQTGFHRRYLYKLWQ